MMSSSRRRRAPSSPLSMTEDLRRLMAQGVYAHRAWRNPSLGGSILRQLGRLAETDLVTVTRSGNQKHYQARRDSPVFEELYSLIVKTVGVAEPLRQALALKARAIRAAFVYGSVAKGTDRARSDIDLMVISDCLRCSDLFEALQAAEAVLGRTVNPTVMTVAQWRAKRARADSFAARVAGQSRVFVIGSDDDLG